MPSFRPKPSFAHRLEPDWQEAPTSKRVPSANLIERSRPSSLPSIPVDLDTEPPAAMRTPILHDPMGPAIPIAWISGDPHSNRPTLPVPSETFIVGEPRPGPCPTPFGMAVPHFDRSGVSPVRPNPRVEHGPGRWLLLLAAAAITAVFFPLGVGFTWLRVSRSPEHGPAAPAMTVSTTPATAGDEEPSPDARFSRLSAVPPADRSIDDNLAMAEARRQRKRSELNALRSFLVEVPEQDRAPAIAKLRGYLDDGETSMDALGVMARLPGPSGPDLLYDVWTATPIETDVTRTAHDLVLSKDVRPNASPALAAALDLRDAGSCEAIRAVLPRVWAHGDRRALTTLVRIARRYPCRTGRAEQCHPCLRGVVSLHDTIETIKGHAPPNPWTGGAQ